MLGCVVLLLGFLVVTECQPTFPEGIEARV